MLNKYPVEQNLPRALAERRAAATMLCLPDSIKDDLDQCWSALNEGNGKLEALEISVWEPFEGSDDDSLFATADDQRYVIEDDLNNYGAWIQRGATIAAIDGWLDSDVGGWDVQQMALIGFNTSAPRSIAGITYSFDLTDCRWHSEAGEALDYDNASGLPKAGPCEERLPFLRIAEGWEQQTDETWKEWYSRQNQMLAKVMEESKALTGDQVVGMLLKFPVADGKAYYRVTGDTPLSYELLPVGDAYAVAEAHLRGLRREELLEIRNRKVLFG